MKNLFYVSKFYLMALAFLAFACGEDGGDPPPPPQPVADFTFEADAENPFVINFTNASENAEEYLWDFGDGETSTEVSPSHTYAATGSYEVTLTATNGELTDEITKTVTIESPGGVPTGPNIVEGGDMTDPAAWTVMAGAAAVVDHQFTEDGLVFSGDGEPETLHQLHVWQPIEVVAGQEYLFFADVSGGGFNNGYLEVVIGSEIPEEGENYDPTWYLDPANPADVPGLKGIHPKNSKVAGINFWLDCGIESFDGNILDVACDPEGLASDAAGENSTNGRITFPESGTYYLLLKAGNYQGSLGPNGVTVYEVFLAPVVGE